MFLLMLNEVRSKSNMCVGKVLADEILIILYTTVAQECFYIIKLFTKIGLPGFCITFMK